MAGHSFDAFAAVFLTLLSENVFANKAVNYSVRKDVSEIPPNATSRLTRDKKALALISFKTGNVIVYSCRYIIYYTDLLLNIVEYM